MTTREGPSTFTLEYAPPYDWPAMRSFFAARAIAGVELVDAGRYQRTIGLGDAHGRLEVTPLSDHTALSVSIWFPDANALPTLIRRVRELFDLDSDVRAIAAQLRRDPMLAKLIEARPGLRVPGCFDPFELAIRAVLGQQVTVSAARRLAAKLVAAHGAPLDATGAAGLERAFPTPERLAEADLGTLGMPRKRAETLRRLAQEAAARPQLFDRSGSLDDKVARLRALPGIGEWTAQYIALRALRDPDAFPAADIGLLRALEASDGTRPSAAAALARAERWRPFRAYAAQHLWTAGTTH